MEPDDPPEPHYMQNSFPGHYNFFCVNGDFKTPGKKVLYNRKYYKDFRIFMDHLTHQLQPRFGPVRHICTPREGHRVRSSRDLRPGDCYVVKGREGFVPYGYKDIDISPKRSRSKQAEELPDTSRKFQVSARHKKINTQATAIKCWLNGKGTLGPKIILLSPHRNRPKTVDEVVECVSCVMEECCWGVVDKLYQLNGIRVLAMDQIVQNGNYFAVLRKRPMVKDTYREASLPAFICSPQSRRRLPPLPGSNKTSSHSSPEHSVTSRNGYRRERQHAREDKDSVVMAHPVKVKRKQQQQQQQPNYDQDKGGVFKAKNENRATRGARPVEDSAYTRTELPLDQRVAEPVLDESDQAPHTQQEQERTYRTNARRAHSPASEESRREKERQARQRREEEDRARAERQQQQQEAIRRRKKEKEEQQRKKQQQEEKEEQEKEEKERRRRAEKERERDEERRRRAKKEKEEEEEERRRRKMEEEEKKKKRKEEEPRKATPRTPTPDKSRDTPQRADTSTLPNSQDSHAQQEEEWAATKIQAGFRGYRERRDLKQRDARNGQDSRQSQDEPIPFLEDDEDLDLGPGPNDDNNNDHDHQHHHRDHDDRLEQEKAATKIQAGFRGAKARKEVEVMRGEREAREEQERAATKIQAGFRGAKARREVEVMRAEKEM